MPGSSSSGSENNRRPEPATCTEAEPFALRVLDDSMLPEFRRGCIIVIDPTGRATDGSFVLARNSQSSENKADDVDDFIFRQLRRSDTDQWTLHALNKQIDTESIVVSLDDVAGVIVQRAGGRRSYHKHYV